MSNTLTRYSSFEAMKAAICFSTFTADEKKRLQVEARQLAELLQALRAEKHDKPA